MYSDLEGIPFYVGKGKGYRHYVSNHIQKQCPNQLLKRKILKIGVENVVVQFLHKELTEEVAFYLEEYYIFGIGRRDKGLGPLCNLTAGGEGMSGRIFSKETRQKLSDAQKGHVGYNKGLKHSEKSKQKIAKALKGNQNSLGHLHSNESKKKMSIVNKNMTFSEEHRKKLSLAAIGNRNGVGNKSNTGRRKK